MPLTIKGKKILKNMRREYGAEKGTRIFYASENNGTITGVHKMAKKHAKKHAKKAHKKHTKLGKKTVKTLLTKASQLINSAKSKV